MNSYEIWHAFSYVWTEIGLDDDEFILYANKLKIAYPRWQDIDRILFRDICLSFSLESAMLLVAVFPPLILLVGVSPWPDWGYETEYLNSRAQKWYSRPYWQHLLNPLRLIGYPLAVLMVFGFRHKLKKAFLKVSAV